MKKVRETQEGAGRGREEGEKKQRKGWRGYVYIKRRDKGGGETEKKEEEGTGRERGETGRDGRGETGIGEARETG